jgi:hypothetical protein
LSFLEAAAELDAGAMREPVGLESSVGIAERLCQEVRDLLAKVRSMLNRIRDVSIPDSTSNTMAGILEALAVKTDGEDPLVAAVHRQVTIGSESVFLMSTHAFVLVDSVGPPSAEVCRAAASFP